ncbi:MAG: ATP-dependent DNA ligase [Methanomicrobiales archaeon]|nr:ATP-dependent DNA ligase [Methanomicrobiales archaeon]
MTPEKDAAFVVHEHHARHLHYDLRLERDGVLKSWAIPKGIPDQPGTKHLAVEVGDHPLSFLDFSGEIPEGEYGAGSIKIWDTGRYIAKFWGPEMIEFVALGTKMHGLYVLLRFHRAGGRNWLIMHSDSLEERKNAGA